MITDLQATLATNIKGMKRSAIRELLKFLGQPGLISLSGGFPSPLTFPTVELKEIMCEVMDTEAAFALQYGATEGDILLRTLLVNRYKAAGVDMSIENMIITTASQQALDLIAKIFIDRGDSVIVGLPSYLGGLSAFNSYGANMIGIPMDDEGEDVQIMEDRIKEQIAKGKKPKFIYVIPDFQNPAGISMSLKRRHELLNFCVKENILIMEDNPYSRLRFTGEPLPTLFHIAHEEMHNSYLVTEIISFSKILGPGMRVAFAKGDPDLINKMVSWQQKVNVTPDCVTQRVVAKYFAAGHMNPHIQWICEFYKPYLDKMLDCLNLEMPNFVQWTKPQGGIFLWLWLPEDLNADKLFFSAKDHLVAFIPGSKFYPEGQEKYNCLRLNYTYSSFEQIETGIKRLAQLLKSIYT